MSVLQQQPQLKLTLLYQFYTKAAIIKACYAYWSDTDVCVCACMRIDPDATVHVILIQFQNYSATEYISNETIRQSILADV